MLAATETEAAKAKERREGALVIVDQIKIREAQRELELEQKDTVRCMLQAAVEKLYLHECVYHRCKTKTWRFC